MFYKLTSEHQHSLLSRVKRVFVSNVVEKFNKGFSTKGKMKIKKM